MDTPHRTWNQNQAKLRKMLLQTEDHSNAIQLFIEQHRMLHTADNADQSIHSFADEVLSDLAQDKMRIVPPKFEHSIVWIFWHLARIEDITMSCLLEGKPQVFLSHGWLDKLGIEFRDTGNCRDTQYLETLNNKMNIDSLLQYRQVVGRNTQSLVKSLEPARMKKIVQSDRLQALLDQGAVIDKAKGLIDYWGKRKIAELLLMPPTRHNFIHLNEAMRIKKQLG